MGQYPYLSKTVPKRIIDLSYELGNTQNEAQNNNYAKPAAWGFQPLPPLLHKERPQPQPKALPLSRGRDATARIRSLGH